MNKEIAVLLTCHNRRDKTLTCLQALYQCALPEGHTLNIFLVDDGSCDGTGQAVKEEFPVVHIIQGNGNLFWNRGMHLAWETAAKAKSFDFYLWLNDDTIIKPFALQLAVEASFKTNLDSIICGATQANNGDCTYSSYKRIIKEKFEKLTPNGQLQRCEVFNGNFVLISKSVFLRVGNLDPYFTHFLGDFDYGLRASNIGIHSYLLQDFIGYCEVGSPQKNKAVMTKFERLSHLYSPLGNNPIQFFEYMKRHFGMINAIKCFISSHYKAFLTKD